MFHRVISTVLRRLTTDSDALRARLAQVEYESSIRMKAVEDLRGTLTHNLDRADALQAECAHLRGLMGNPPGEEDVPRTQDAHPHWGPHWGMVYLRAPVPIVCSVPGLLTRGLPLIDAGGIPCVYEGVQDPLPPEWWHAGKWCVDWSSPTAIDIGIRWLFWQGYDVGWLRGESVGGNVPPCGDLTEEKVSAILVSVSILRVNSGGGPVTSFYQQDWGTIGEAQYSSVSMSGCATLLNEESPAKILVSAPDV